MKYLQTSTHDPGQKPDASPLGILIRSSAAPPRQPAPLTPPWTHPLLKPIPIWVYGIIKVCLWLFMINFVKYIISPSFPQCNKKHPKAPLPVRKSSVSTNPDLFHLSSLLKAFPIPPPGAKSIDFPDWFPMTEVFSMKGSRVPHPQNKPERKANGQPLRSIFSIRYGFTEEIVTALPCPVWRRPTAPRRPAR